MTTSLVQTESGVNGVKELHIDGEVTKVKWFPVDGDHYSTKTYRTSDQSVIALRVYNDTKVSYNGRYHKDKGES